MKILELCPFSAGICGVWIRVKQEAEQLARKGHDVYVFSSNIEKGTNKIAKEKEVVGEIKIRRFKSRQDFISKFISRNVIYFDFEKELIKLKPSRVITHLFHPHSFKVLKICQKLKIPCYIVPHAPFEVKRNSILSILTKTYYFFKVKPKINQFTKIISITKWEQQHLKKLGALKEKIEYIPNGIPDKFFKQTIKPPHNRKILFLGRIAPIKNLEIPIEIINHYEKNLFFEIIGPIENGYEKIKKYSSGKIKFLNPIYDLDKKIKKLQEADIFVLPSKREAMPQALIEAMALGKIVISSNTLGAKEIIKNKENGFLFKVGDKNDFKKTLDYVFSLSNKELVKIQKNARKSVEIFKWSKLSVKLINLLK